VLLRTALVPGDVRRIVRLLGYRPRPGIAATGVVAARTASTDPFVIPAGFPIEGATEASDDPVQIFESDEAVEIGTLRTQVPPTAGFSKPPSAGHWKGRPTKRADGKTLSAVPATTPIDPYLNVTAGQLFKVSLDGVIA